MKRFAAVTLAMSVNGATVLTENAYSWQATLTWENFDGFVQTDGLGLSGEVGWHTHGSGDNIDVDVDLAMILTSTGDIDKTYTTMFFWAI